MEDVDIDRIDDSELIRLHEDAIARQMRPWIARCFRILVGITPYVFLMAISASVRESNIGRWWLEGFAAIGLWLMVAQLLCVPLMGAFLRRQLKRSAPTPAESR